MRSVCWSGDDEVMISFDLLTDIVLWPKIKGDFQRWQAILETSVNFSLASSNIHTRLHEEHVLLFSLLMAEDAALSDEEREVLGAAAVFHDTRRRNDRYDVGHGRRAAQYYKQFCEQKGWIADDRVDFLLSYHDQPDELGLAFLKENNFSGLKSLYDIFKDADGVDRVRLGPNALDCDRLRTRKSLTLVPLAKQLNQERSINGRAEREMM